MFRSGDRMKKESMISTCLMLIFWWMTSFLINNEFILPGPFDVLDCMISQLQRPDFFLILWSTSKRALWGCFLSLFFGGAIGLWTGLIPAIERYFAPLYQLLKTIPNITYMILILIWLGQENSVTVIVFLILFPVFYAEIFLRTRTIHLEYQHLLQVYPVSLFYKLKRIMIPLLKGELCAQLKTGIGMSFKICVMAEILGQVQIGIGRQMNYSRLNLDLASVFGWTIWMILVSWILQIIVDVVQKITYDK